MITTIKIDKHLKDIEKVETLALEAFPPEEYLAPSKLIEMSKEDNFEFLALYDENNFIGFIVVKLYKNMAYLFFLAIDKKNRGQGYGSKVIQKLKELYPNYNHVVDFEMVDKNAPNYQQRIKRKEFYLKNGYKEIGQFLSYLGVDYEVMTMNDKFDLNLFKELMSTLKIKGFKPQYFTN